MKVLNLQCAVGHRFEGWFQNEADFLTQKDNRLLVCPVCENPVVHKLPSSARLNLRGVQKALATDSSVKVESNTESEQKAKPTSTPAQSAASPSEQRQWLHAMRNLVRKTEDVGVQFTEQALQMHNGELEERPIRGQASREQVHDLLDQGVSVLPIPAILKDPVH